MIFFVIKNAALTATNFSSITTPVRSAMKWDAAGVNLIAWNEVPAYSTPDTFRDAILEEAKTDPVCQAMCVVSKSSYGMDPLDPGRAGRRRRP
ncbi:MAG TPA: hypothetical protein VF794_22100 [Archangium sp.]|jgi:hypothetical protein|uniref:hypothetical protein n=1 Tax=Archangium sp. TaxID=1872627 RepID=UPI002EDB2693